MFFRRRRPRLAILGDFYVVCNSTFNQHVEEAIEKAGGEALPCSFIDISHYGYLNKIDLFYDGLRSPNEKLEHYIFYLRQKKASSLPIPY